MVALSLSPDERRRAERGINRQAWKALCAAAPDDVDPEVFTEEVSWAMYKIQGAVKITYLVTLLQSLMADGRDEDTFMPPMLYLRLRDFLRDHGTPQDNWKKLLAQLGR